MRAWRTHLARVLLGTPSRWAAALCSGRQSGSIPNDPEQMYKHQRTEKHQTQAKADRNFSWATVKERQEQAPANPASGRDEMPKEGR